MPPRQPEQAPPPGQGVPIEAAASGEAASGDAVNDVGGHDHPGQEDAATAIPQEPETVALQIGARVEVCRPLRYLKTSDPMPMLRPPDLVDPGEVGTVTAIRMMGQVSVRFRRGSFLINSDDLKLC
ncbi:NAD(P)H dehydrogenase assembly family protein [Synechococcus sp. CCY9201]|uniref:NAD(P)H dehydrogenase assembly family protein n=1 Tax=Synechococcus sp. CBW1107 TaxID=2789857 RepID=UPI002AD4F0A7|nr:NAD(P)H dehydrogenase assembly family protein [Synechococcus sp. CBW1107]MEA5473133.1 NAD(P)H dehydrogenase assembly family protein [Synechococcus sp. CCY9201]